MHLSWLVPGFVLALIGAVMALAPWRLSMPPSPGQLLDRAGICLAAIGLMVIGVGGGLPQHFARFLPGAGLAGCVVGFARAGPVLLRGDW